MPDWNYDLNGTDWTMGNCGNYTRAQSPWALVNTPDDIFTWDSMVDYSFLTAWKEATVYATQHDVINYTYYVNLTDDSDLGIFYAVEPFAAGAMIQWKPTQIRFKYPSEHIIDGIQYDFEMQVMMNDTLERSQWCYSHQGAFSFLFNIGTEQSDFWNWVGQDSGTINLEYLFTMKTSMTTQMWGYVATDTMPECLNKFCWYFNTPAGTITQATLDALKVDGVNNNNR